jgi:hypothetical protein
MRLMQSIHGNATAVTNADPNLTLFLSIMIPISFVIGFAFCYMLLHQEKK